MSDAALETVRVLLAGLLALGGVWLGNRHGRQALDRQLEHDKERADLQDRRTALSAFNSAAVTWAMWVQSLAHVHDLGLNGAPIREEVVQATNSKMNQTFETMHQAFSHLVLVCSDDFLPVLREELVDRRNLVQAALVDLTASVDRTTVAAVSQTALDFTTALGELIEEFRVEAGPRRVNG